MNAIRTVSSAAAGALCVAAALLGGVGPAAAVPTTGAGSSSAIEPPPTSLPHDYGLHANGWQVIIHNESNTPLPFFVQAPWNKISSRAGSLQVHGTAHIYGAKAAFGGPADIDFEYRAREGAFADGVYLRVATDDYVVLPMCLTTFSPTLKCEITQADFSKPVEFTLTAK